MRYIVDASLVIRYLDGEEGAFRMKEILRKRFGANARLLISSIHRGEVAGIFYKRANLLEIEFVGPNPLPSPEPNP